MALTPKFAIPARLPQAPERYDRENEQKFRRILELALIQRDTGERETLTEEDSSGILPRRRVVRGRVDEIDEHGKGEGVFVFPGTATAILLDARAYKPLWLRVYASAEDRDADADRAIDDYCPTTPIILDAAFGQTSLETPPVDPEPFVAEASCTAPTNIARAWDGDELTYWTPRTGAPNVGDKFSVDLGTDTRVSSVRFDTIHSTLHEYAHNVTVEIKKSTDAAWRTAPATVTLGSKSFVRFNAPTTFRYFRVTISGSQAEDWKLADFFLYGAPIQSARLRLFDGEVEGIIAPNWDNPARARLYFAVQLLVNEPQGFIYRRLSFTTATCELRAWFIDGGGNIVYGDPTSTHDNCDTLSILSPWLDTEWTDSGSTRPRYFLNWNQLRAGTQDPESIARFYGKPKNKDFVGFKTALQQSDPDATGMSSAFAAYLHNGGNGSWNTRPYLLMGVERTGYPGVAPFIEWRDSNGDTHVLASGSDFGDFTTVFSGTIRPDGDTVVATMYDGDGNELCSAEVPEELRTLASHNRVGFRIITATAGGAPQASVGWGHTWLQVDGGDASIPIDLGYIPVERSGGVLTPPRN